MVRARFVLLVAATLLGGALPARAAAEAQEPNPFRIGQTMIGRAPLGKPLKFYPAAYGSPGVRVRGSGGFDRVIFADSRLEVLFRPGSTPTAVGVITWAARVETARGVGACTLTRRLVATYGLKLRRVALGEK